MNQTAAWCADVLINVTTPLVGVHGDVTEDWSSVAANSFAFESLTVGSADLYQGVTLLGSGVVAAVPASADVRAVATSDGNTVAVSGVRVWYPVAARGRLSNWRQAAIGRPTAPRSAAGHRSNWRCKTQWSVSAATTTPATCVW